jgi:uncharacterized protein
MNQASQSRAGRRLRKAVLVVVLTYLGVVILMLFLENRLVYRRETAADHWEEPPDPSIRDVTFPAASGLTIHGWYCDQPGSSEVLLFCHGNGGNVSYRGLSLLRFRDLLGCSTLIFDYPGYGKSDGKPSEAGCYDSAEAALRWLEDVKHAPSERVIVYGESLGGGVAVEMARRHAPRALVLMKTFTSLPAIGQRQYPFLPVKWLMYNRFDNLAKIGEVHRPVFIASATHDTLVPFEMGKELYAAANEPKAFFALEGDDHGDKVSDEFLLALRRFLDRHSPQ